MWQFYDWWNQLWLESPKSQVIISLLLSNWYQYVLCSPRLRLKLGWVIEGLQLCIILEFTNTLCHWIGFGDFDLVVLVIAAKLSWGNVFTAVGHINVEDTYGCQKFVLGQRDPNVNWLDISSCLRHAVSAHQPGTNIFICFLLVHYGLYFLLWQCCCHEGRLCPTRSC